MRGMESETVNCVVTSPPYYGLRDYGIEGQMGLEPTLEQYIGQLAEVFREVKRVLKNDGTLWLNMGDSYAGSGKGAWNNKHGGQKEVYIPDTGSAQSKLTKVPRNLKPKDLMGVPWRVAFALQSDGWYLRQDIIWAKPNPMPESVTDRCTKSHEYIFLFSKLPKYYYDNEAIKDPTGPKGDANGFRGGAYCNNDSNNDTMEKRTHVGNKKQRVPAGWDTRQGAHGAFHREGRSPDIEYVTSNLPFRNKRSVWTVATRPFKEAHFATFPEELIRPCIKAGSPIGGTVLDPFVGAGTVPVVCIQEQRNYIGIEINPKYIEITKRRIACTERSGSLFSAESLKEEAI